jgi:DNA primase catalytic subunit
VVLLELCFITNIEDLVKYDAQSAELAIEIAKLFNVTKHDKENIILKEYCVHLNFFLRWINNIACYLWCQKKDLQTIESTKLKVITLKIDKSENSESEHKAHKPTVNNQDQTTISRKPEPVDPNKEAVSQIQANQSLVNGKNYQNNS